jgi:hypothetical protein
MNKVELLSERDRVDKLEINSKRKYEIGIGEDKYERIMYSLL